MGILSGNSQIVQISVVGNNKTSKKAARLVGGVATATDREKDFTDHAVILYN